MFDIKILFDCWDIALKESTGNIPFLILFLLLNLLNY